jgi:hypothetical protein
MPCPSQCSQHSAPSRSTQSLADVQLVTSSSRTSVTTHSPSWHVATKYCSVVSGSLVGGHGLHLTASHPLTCENSEAWFVFTATKERAVAGSHGPQQPAGRSTHSPGPLHAAMSGCVPLQALWHASSDGKLFALP